MPIEMPCIETLLDMAQDAIYDTGHDYGKAVKAFYVSSEILESLKEEAPLGFSTREHMEFTKSKLLGKPVFTVNDVGPDHFDYTVEL